MQYGVIFFFIFFSLKVGKNISCFQLYIYGTARWVISSLPFSFFPFSTQYVYYAEVLNWDYFSVLSCGTVGVNLFLIKAGCVYFMVQTCTFVFAQKSF